jgi:hypothetical protein
MTVVNSNQIKLVMIRTIGEPEGETFSRVFPVEIAERARKG